MSDTPEAGIPVFNPLAKSNVHNPELITANAGVAATLYNRSLEGDYDKLIIQNCGTSAVKVAINNIATDALFNYVLAGCSSQDDGLGSVLTFDNKDGVKSLSAINASNAIRVSVVKFYKIGML